MKTDPCTFLEVGNDIPRRTTLIESGYLGAGTKHFSIVSWNYVALLDRLPT